MEKEPQSLSVQMKPEYASSEVYSTVSSEAPPAYKVRQANSVKIAKIIAATIILSSFILGGFILAATYMQSRAVCDQIQTLENALDKEMMLEMLAQELPKPSALQGRDAGNFNDIENDAKKPSRKDNDINNNIDSSSDSQYSDSDESQDMNRVQFKLPLDIDLNELAAKFLQNGEQQKTKMNCVVERRRAEELVNGEPKTVQLPFGINLQTEPKRQRVTGERIAIVCESHMEPQQDEEERDEPEIHVRQFIVPIQQHPIPYGNIPNPGMGPLTHMPMRIEPQMNREQIPLGMSQIPPIIRQLIAQHTGIGIQQQSQPPVPQQIMQAPPMQQPQIRFFHAMREEPQPQQQQQPQMVPQQMEPEVRIQLHRIAIPGPVKIPEQAIDAIESQSQQEREDQPPQPPRFQVQQVPLNMALQRAGITPEDLINIQKIAEARFRQEMTRIAQAMDDESDSSESDEQTGSQMPPQQQQQEQEEVIQEKQQTQDDEMKAIEANNESSEPKENPNILPMGRSGYARSLLKPVNIPVQMMPKGEVAAAEMEDKETKVAMA